VNEQPVLLRNREGKPGGGKGPLMSEDKSLTLGTSNDQTLFQPIGFSHTQGLSAQPSEDAFPTLRSNGGGMAVETGEPNLVVRRLTPLECERLMGWPDNHTAVGINGPVSDTNRYKMCGNGVASPVAAWIGKHLMNVRSDAENTE
jgi:DNA (cytosine-5)-methyltransferase 1